MSPRARIALVVGVVALLAVGGVVAGAVFLGDDTPDAAETSAGTSPAPTGEAEPEAPALELAVTDRDDEDATALRRGEFLYEEGDQDGARERFDTVLAADPDSLEAAVGVAYADWPDGTLEELEALVLRFPGSAVVRLNLGLVRLALGDLDAAREEWREAEKGEPDAPAALKAEDLLNPQSPPGRPQFFLTGFPDEAASLTIGRRIEALRRRAENGSARDWLFLGSTLEQAGRRVSAQRAYDRALELDPGSLDAQVARHVARFDKDDPSAAFSRLGPLASRHPDAAVVRFHLGLMLLWLPDLERAREQLAAARTAAPRSFYGRQADRILTELENA
jgi:tetratricopeptide (TPR) repeat protein